MRVTPSIVSNYVLSLNIIANTLNVLNKTFINKKLLSL